MTNINKPATKLPLKNEGDVSLMGEVYNAIGSISMAIEDIRDGVKSRITR